MARATDYSKLKNAELEQLLKDRNLPHGGKKAEMVARLQDADKETPTDAPVAPTTAAVSAEDEIDWDDDAGDAPAASSKPAAAAVAAGGQGAVDNPTAVPNQVVDTDPSKTDDLAVNTPAAQLGKTAEATTVPAAEAEKKPEVDFARGLASTDIEQEIARRKKRAEKFGLKIEDDKDAQEALQKLERLKKFGDTAAPKGLDEALPERQKKRGRDTGDEGGRGGFKRRGGGQPPPQGRRNDRRGGGRGNDKPARNTEGGPSWMTAADREAAEKRKNRFT